MIACPIRVLLRMLAWLLLAVPVLVADQAVADEATAAAEPPGAEPERCAQLMVQGNTALAQAEGCGTGDASIFSGSIASLSQSFAPAWRALPDDDNPFAALSLYLAPRLTLSERWSLSADTTLAYEQTVPDDQAQRHALQSLDTRLTLLGRLGQLREVTLTGGPRLVIPTSRPSWAARTVGTAVLANLVRPVDVLGGLAFVLGGAYTHFFTGRLTREATEEAGGTNLCRTDRGGLDNCPVSGTAIVGDSLRIVGSMTLSIDAALSFQAAYLYQWALGRRLSERDTIELGPVGEVELSDAGEEGGFDSRLRRTGAFSLTANYQPAAWAILGLSASTTVCYHLDSGLSSATGGCAGGLRRNDFWSRNPIANKHTVLALSLTVPLDVAVSRMLARDREETQSAASPMPRSF